jgi:FKBP-type peptidyl-prolyl cis-trans isomerase 2
MNKGDIVRLEFSLWLADTNTLHNTNNEFLAKEQNMYHEEHRYVPLPYIVGNAGFYAPIEESLQTAKVGEEVEVTITPDKGEGDRKADLVQIFPFRRIASLPQYKKEESFPAIGDRVEIEGREGRIVALIAGRVRVDFNHELAGKTLKFKYKVTEVATDPQAKIKAMIDMVYRYSDDFHISDRNDVISMVVPEVCKYDPAWTLGKMKLVALLREHVDFKSVHLIEEWTKTPPEEKNESKEHDHAYGHEHKKEEENKEEKKPEETPPEKKEG